MDSSVHVHDDANWQGLDFNAEIAALVLDSTQGLEALRGIIASSSESLLSETASIAEASSAFSETSSFVGRVTEIIGNVDSLIDAAHASARRSQEISVSVSGLLDDVRQISFKTNLIALNASVEAARAGDAGRGFSVIASEVRDLAVSARDTTNAILAFVNNIGTETAAAQENIAAAKNDCSNVLETAGMLAERAGITLSLASRMQDMLERTAKRTFIQTVKLDHFVWKNAVYRVAFGTSDATPGSFADHRNCRLGKWYLAEGKRRYGSERAYQALDEPHALVHSAGIAALRARAEGDDAACIANFAEMERASDRVIQLLDALEARMV